MLHLQTNELLDTEGNAAETVLKQDYSILSAGCGNLRNLIYTITSLPDAFEGNLHVTMNDNDPFIQARNVLFLFMMIQDDPDVASKITTIWYSMHLPEDTYKMLMECLKRLCVTNATLLKFISNGRLNISQEDFEILRQVWKGWIRVDYEQTHKLKDSLSKQRDDLQFGDDLSNTVDYLTFYMKQLPKHHEKSLESWIYNGDFLPQGNTAKYLPTNPTLTCRRDRGAIKVTDVLLYSKATVPRIRQCPNDVEFKFGVPLNCLPFSEWDYLQASKFSSDESLLVMYHAYVTNQIQESIAFIKEGRLSLRVNVGHCLELTDDDVDGDKFDRIFTINLADYLGTKTLLDWAKPLLNNNKHAVITTMYFNWHQYFPLTQTDHEMYVKYGTADICLDMARLDTNKLQGQKLCMDECQEYFDDSAHFINYLRADLLGCQYMSDYGATDEMMGMIAYVQMKLPTKKLPSYKQVQQCSDGLIMRDFLRELNRVAPWKYRVNARKPSFLGGLFRIVEWYRV